MVKNPFIGSDNSLSPSHNASAIQQRAAQPNASIWVSASAGTGKTKVLTDRVLNLLLRGIPPRKILCLTYTRAAATEMTLRLMQRLSRWATLEDSALEMELRTLQEQTLEVRQQKIQAKHFRRARQLFIDVLNTPGGLNIQTIHSFCQSVLQKFPMEASIPPNFEVADPTLTQQLLEASLHELFIVAQKDAHLMQCLEFVSARLSLASVAERLQEMLMKPIALRALQAQGLTIAIQKLYADLKILRDKSWSDHLQAYYAETSRADLLNCLPALQQGGVEDKERARIVQSALTNADTFINNFDAYARAFLTQEGQPRARLASKNAQSQNSQMLPILLHEADRLSQLMIVQKSYMLARQSEVWMALGLWIFERYNLKKQEQGLLDYDDLITKTYELLHKPGLAPFVLYKLDGGIHHILVDEAQDTSPLQWGLIAALVEEFFSGQGSIGGTTSLFAVGDFKQSIYSFQGAEPYLFHQMRTHFAGKVEAAQQHWHNLEMQISFRSTPAILKAVDGIFASLQASQGVMDPGSEKIQHQSFLPTGAGLVELWPLAPGNIGGESEDTSSSRKPEDRLAEVIAHQIRKWLDNKALLEAKGRPVTPGDILILVQRRNHFIYALMRALKKENIPTAGIDRLELMEHIAVQDLLALCQFLLLPENDLALAIVLKSPLVGFDEDLLFTLTTKREKGTSLWSTLKAQHPLFEQAYGYLRHVLKRVDYISPFHLLADVLYADGGLKKFMTRMGPTVQEILEEFLTLAQNYENAHEASLQKFLHWCENASNEIKRDLATSELNEVRIMTVHGAKGLQAPIVIVADTTRVPGIQDSFIWNPEGYMLANVGKASEVEVLTTLKDTARQKILEEYRRLLYVALTRAEEQLYICGWEPHHTLNNECWYSLCQQGLSSIASNYSFDFSQDIADGWQEAGLRFYQPPLEPFVQKISTQGETVKSEIVLPPFLLHPAPYEAPKERPKTASHTEDAATTSQTTVSQDRGTYLHKLLEILPTLDKGEWFDTAQRLVQDYPTVQDSEILFQQVVNILEDPQLAFIFGAQSWPEVPVLGTIDGTFYSTQIDRLVVEKDRVLIVDYKSNQKIPATVSEAPHAYITQLAIYQKLVQALYPDKKVETYLLWTQKPSLMKVHN